MTNARPLKPEVLKGLDVGAWYHSAGYPEVTAADAPAHLLVIPAVCMESDAADHFALGLSDAEAVDLIHALARSLGRLSILAPLNKPGF